LGYSSAGASKDAHNREKSIERLRKSYNSGVLKKEHINKQGYNKFLRLENEVAVILDQSKIDADKLWDGLKGYITNTELPAWEVIDQYHGLSTIRINMPLNNRVRTQTLFLTDEQESHKDTFRLCL
jgi:predicted ATPase